MKRLLIPFALMALPLLAGSCHQQAQPFEGPVTVFECGENGINTYRIPALVATRQGTLLAFSEARVNTHKDFGDNNIVVKRSLDGGRTWGETITIWDEGVNCCSSPVPVVLESGRILLLCTWKVYTVPNHYFDINWFSVYSDDDGLTWSEPRKISDGLVEDDWIMACVGPGHAIQLQEEGAHKGRIIVPCYHKWEGEGKLWQGRSFFIWSDDGGETWTRGGFSERGGNECSAAELSNGDIMLNMREFKRWADTTALPQCRQVSISSDGGETLSGIVFDAQLPEPVCQGSLLRYRHGHQKEDWLLFMNPTDQQVRKDLKVKLSRDRGANWEVVYETPFARTAYSDMTELPDGSVGLLYECGDSTARERIVFDLLPAAAIR